MRPALLLLALHALGGCGAPQGAGGGGAGPGDEPALTVETAVLEVAPGAEVQRSFCTTTGNTAEIAIGAFRLEATQGMHHTQLIQVAPSFRFLYATSTLVRDDEQRLPAGVILPLGAGARVCLEVHFLNAARTPLSARARVDLFRAAPAANAERAAMFAFQTQRIAIPARGGASATFSCRFPYPAQIVTLVPHTHTRGRRVEVRFAGGPRDAEVVRAWDQVLEADTQRFDPPLHFAAGEGLTVTCTWDNASDAPVAYGVTADQEMCLVAGLHHPASSDLIAEVGSGTGPADCVPRAGLVGIAP